MMQKLFLLLVVLPILFRPASGFHAFDMHREQDRTTGRRDHDQPQDTIIRS
ncbi:hypothetical protein [Komagataeibacter xylinus]|uniref:hypothetical protein n=1 Tax=Komagataeibacter xylinus TaxID=28448 RepID=UPI0013EDFA89|nr:hypothetical protein [Komagataeibacter xylinus]